MMLLAYNMACNFPETKPITDVGFSCDFDFGTSVAI